MNEAVAAYELESAFIAYDAVKGTLEAYDAVNAYEALATLFTVTGNVELFPLVKVIVALLAEAVINKLPVSN
jgi:hypothetical protein